MGETETPPYSEILFYTISCLIGGVDDILANQKRDKVVSYEYTTKGGKTGKPCSKVLTSEFLNPRIYDKNYYWPDDGTLYTPGQFQADVWKTKRNPNTARVGKATLQTQDAKYNLDRMPACCPEGTCDSKKCFSPVTKDCWVWVWPGTGTDNRVQWMGQCHVCNQIDCGNTCANGEYANAYTQFDKLTGLREPSVVCTACPPGTFNTCTQAGKCTW
jgi:hypothetical protein